MMMSSSAKVKVACDEPGCHLPVGYLKDGVLIIASQHHGHKHTSTINLQAILVEPIDKSSKRALDS